MRDCSYEDEPQWIKAPLHYKIFRLPIAACCSCSCRAEAILLDPLLFNA